MANIKVTSPVPVYDGQPLTFRSPADCSAISGLIVHYPDGDTTASRAFQFADAHGNNVGDYDLFAADALVKVILDTDTSLAFVQNADTNAYLEGRFSEMDTALRDLIGDRAQIILGSYVGAGESGADNPTVLTGLPFEPRLLVVQYNRKETQFGCLLVAIRGSNAGVVIHASGNIGWVTIEWGANSISWYGDGYSPQLNAPHGTYNYIVIG